MKTRSSKRPSLLNRLIWSKHTYIVILVLALALPLLLAVMGQKQTLTQHAATTRQVNMLNYTMNPQSITITAGDTIEWTNLDVEAHDVHSNTDVFISPLLEQNQKWSFTFNDAGTYEYYSTPQRTVMKGTIVVVANPNATLTPTSSVPTPTGIVPTYGCIGCPPPSATVEPTAMPTEVPPTDVPTTVTPTQTAEPTPTGGIEPTTQPGGDELSPTQPSEGNPGNPDGKPGDKPGDKPGKQEGGFLAFLLAFLLAILAFFMKLIGRG